MQSYNILSAETVHETDHYKFKSLGDMNNWLSF